MTVTRRVHQPVQEHDDPARETVRYGIEPDLRFDGDERYHVCAYTGTGEGRTVDLVTITESVASAESDVRRLTNGEGLPYDRRKTNRHAIRRMKGETRDA